MKIAVKNGKNGEWKRMPGSGQQVGSLQELIYRIPELISVESPESDGPSMRLCIKNPSTSNAVNDGGLIGIDDNGRIAIVECKIAKDSSIRREILGQVVEHAAALWEMPYEEFDQIVISSEGRSLVEIMSEKVPKERWSEEIFKNAIAGALDQGKFRLVMVIQGITAELKRTIKFLSARGTFSFETYAVEIQHFSDGDTEIAIPKITSFAEMWQETSLEETMPEQEAMPEQETTPSQETDQEPTIGDSQDSDDSDDSDDLDEPGQPSSSSEPIIGQANDIPERKDKRKEALFFAKCQEIANQNAVEVIRKLYLFSMEASDNIMWWGSGGAGAFNFALTRDQLTVFIVDASGKIMFNFSEWQREPVYKSLLPQFLEKLKDIPVLRRQKGDYTMWPDFDIEDFFNSQNDFVKFEDAVRFLKEELGKLATVSV